MAEKSRAIIEPMEWPNMKYGRSGDFSQTMSLNSFSSSIMVCGPASPQSPHVSFRMAVAPCPTWSLAATMNPASMNATIMWK